MRKQDEIKLYAILRSLPVLSIDIVEAARESIGMSTKRMEYLLLKWSDKRWWDYGVSPRGGWFEDDAPESIDG